MNKTSIMTLRVPIAVRRALERLAAQLGYKPAYLGARLVEEGLRRRHFPLIDLRDTAAGRVAYLKGTRLAVYFVVEHLRRQEEAEKTARDRRSDSGPGDFRKDLRAVPCFRWDGTSGRPGP